jgi:hypothetical protein
MELRFNWRFAFALFVLTLLMGEAHEQAHIQFGYWACGCYGPRDFSVWQVCEACASPSLARFASLTGPLFTYAAIWLGAGVMAWGRSGAMRAVGLALVFAPLPFARIFTVLMGSGDEATFLRSLLGAGPVPVALAVLLVAVSCVPPILIAAARLKAKRRVAWIAALCLLPMLAQGAWVRLVMNGLLARGLGGEPSIAGSPAIVMAHTAVAAVVFAAAARWLPSVVAAKVST